MAYVRSISGEIVFEQLAMCWRSLRGITFREGANAAILAVVIFGVVGTVTALWPNPLFIRMTPTAGFEAWLLTAESLLMGLYFGLRSPACSMRLAGSGGVLGFLGVACPVCNKLLMLLFGGSILMTYFEPIRPMVGGLGLALALVALWLKLRQRAQMITSGDMGDGMPRPSGG